MKKLLQFLQWTINRLKEPSTMGSITALAALAHINVDPGIYQQSVDIFAASTGILGIILSEKK